MNLTPRTVALLGYGGLLPFAASALGLLLAPAYQAFWQTALLGYGAVILSFVGALHWAFAMQTEDPARASALYVWSVVPSLAGWVALLLPSLLAQEGMALAALLLIVAYGGHYLQDRQLARLQPLPGWYLPLRLRLSTGAVLALAVLAGRA